MVLLPAWRLWLLVVFVVSIIVVSGAALNDGPTDSVSTFAPHMMPESWQPAFDVSGVSKDDHKSSHHFDSALVESDDIISNSTDELTASYGEYAPQPSGYHKPVYRPHRFRLDPRYIPKYVEQLVQPKRIFSYESTINEIPALESHRIRMRSLVVPVSEFTSQILPSSFRSGPYRGRTLCWGYDGTYPGPTIESRRGTPMEIQYPNLLDPRTTILHLDYFDIDPAVLPKELNLTSRQEPIAPIPGRPQLFRYTGPIPHVTHLHGSEVESASDGHPEAWYTYKDRQVGHAFIEDVHHHPQLHEAMSLWYHDHSMSCTKFTVFAGISGFNLLRDPKNEPPGLPNTQPYEMEILLQDRDFDVNGQLMHIVPEEANANAAGHGDHEEAAGGEEGDGGTPGEGDTEDENSRLNQHEFFGDFIVVNGRTWPEFCVEPRRYRFRLLNGANSRFFNLSFQSTYYGSRTHPVPWWMIGTEGGFLDHAAPLSSLMLAPAERADVMVDFTGLSIGYTLFWNNSAPADFPSSARLNEHTSQVMQFKIIPLQRQDRSLDPRHYEKGGLSLRPNNPIVRLSPDPKQVDVTRHLTLVQVQHLKDEFIIPHTYLQNNHGFHDHVTESPVAGSTEMWEIINLTSDTHAIHLHLVQYQLLNRQHARTRDYNFTYTASFPGGVMTAFTGPPRPDSPEFPGGNPRFDPFLVGPPIPPPPEEDGWKDVIRVSPRQVTRILVRYTPLDVPLGTTSSGINLYPFTPFGPSNVTDPLTGFRTGHSYVWHCHMLDHEDNDMMRPLGSHSST